MARKKSKPPEDPVTTIQLHESTKKLLENCSRLGETYESAILRLMTGMNEVNFDFLNIDGGSPEDHVVLFKLGEVVQLYDHGVYKEVSKPALVVANKSLGQPKNIV